jgi:8-oxo-dGTP diphosphatase
MATDDTPLYERDPEDWNTSRVKGSARQPCKRVATGIVVCDRDDQLLLVQPTHKPDWDLPGGMVAAKEAPVDAARRQLREALGLTAEIGALLCVDWIPPHGPWEDTLVFVFDGGILSPAAIAALELSDDKLSAFRFCPPHQATQLLRPSVWQRAATALAALRTGRARYVHGGAPIT